MLICLLVGALLAQRFKVFVLVPAIVLTGLVAGVHGYYDAASSWQIVGAVVADIVCLQIGYLAGAGIYHFIIARLANAMHRRLHDQSIASRRAAH